MDRIFRSAPGRPCRDAASPAGERGRAIAADIEFLRTMQAQIEEISGDVLAVGKLDGVGEDERHTVPAQQCDETRRHEALVADLDRVANFARGQITTNPRSAGDALIVPS